MNIAVIIAAGGKSQRYGEKNKLFERAGTGCVIVEAIKPFLDIAGVSRMLIGIHPSFSDELLVALDNERIEDKRISLVSGGATRTETVKNAISALPEDVDTVLIHDGARPYVTRELILRTLAALKNADAAVVTVRSSDAMIRLKDMQPMDREKFGLVQTPFACKRDVLEKAYKNSKKAFYDDVSVVKTLDNVKIAQVDGDPKNKKITHPCDLEEPLVGCGYDIHRLKAGEGLTLCGVFIPCPYKSVAHSDGDVPVHAIMDAILTAVGERDIGHFFPVDDPAYDGANSLDLLKTVLSVAEKCGKRVSNVSVSIIAEKPIIAPHILKMKRTLSPILDISIERIGISATTNEQVGDIGSGDAIAAFATVLLK